MRTTTPHLRRAAVLGSLALLAVACSDEIDADKLEDSIRERAEEAFDGYEIGDVDCPEGIELVEGDVFDCDLEVEGETVTIEVTQEDDEGNVTIEQAQAVLDLDKVVEAVEAGILEQLGVTAEIDCGDDAVRVEDPGDTFECSAAADDGSTGIVDVLVVDVDGNVEWQLR
jgi:hypothetical protein